MRTLLSISAIALLLAACSDDRPVTAPAATWSAEAAPAPTGALVQAAGKPVAFSSFSVSGLAKTIFGDPGNYGATSTATCPAGSVVTGGGFTVTSGHKDVRVSENKSNTAANAWVVSAGWYGDDFTGTNYGTFTAFATCIK
jgi:hypothetical protein